MKKIGKVEVATRKNNFLVRTTESFRIGSIVVNESIKKVGRIVDIIGPANNPYIVINVKEAEQPVTTGEIVYLLDKPSTSTRSSKKSYPKKYHQTSSKPKK